ncbi:hypothetical protein SAMN05216257_102539 [Meinhardsimonia xiamenensis]|jgi:hypothetical protein|uniref:Uncharacterized protein n=1 Tax=Meinhardsimonia xiamenensis TaxID=990712 RepID=A0A1G9BGV7_9RHOB|nr:hypothetical protein [Meinhardsimonia xiamenensis]PRX34987.1 hypothetical protein LV81_01580 [Meinhardsimonia xiamenensis]SDK38667.1 hypothetical protein SAMN05216257_102539 [Meinhardsimonia xiamenensis]
MESLIWIGTAVTLAGVVALIACVVTVARAKARRLDDAALKAALQRIIPLNLGALLLSAVGLMLVVLGILLG